MARGPGTLTRWLGDQPAAEAPEFGGFFGMAQALAAAGNGGNGPAEERTVTMSQEQVDRLQTTVGAIESRQAGMDARMQAMLDRFVASENRTEAYREKIEVQVARINESLADLRVNPVAISELRRHEQLDADNFRHVEDVIGSLRNDMQTLASGLRTDIQTALEKRDIREIEEERERNVWRRWYFGLFAVVGIGILGYIVVHWVEGDPLVDINRPVVVQPAPHP